MKQELNFIFDPSIASLINKVAYEKVFYDYDYDGAIKFLTECLQIDNISLFNNIILKKSVLDFEDGYITITSNNEDPIDIIDWYYKIVDKIDDNCKGCGYKWEESIAQIVKRLSKSTLKDISFSIPFESYLYYKNILDNEGDYEEGVKWILTEMKDSSKFILEYEVTLDWIKKDIDKLEKAFKIATSLSNAESIALPSIYYNLKQYYKILTDPKEAEKEGLYAFESQLHVEKYIENTIKLDKLEDINPTTEYCNGGWISPTGKYYGLNGEIANFLHLRIAELLVVTGVIPLMGANKPERYLETAGWLKQHDNNIYGYNTTPTKEQMKTIKNIISQKYNCVQFGLEAKYPISKVLEIDEIQLKRLF